MFEFFFFFSLVSKVGVTEGEFSHTTAIEGKKTRQQVKVTRSDLHTYLYYTLKLKNFCAVLNSESHDDDQDMPYIL